MYFFFKKENMNQDEQNVILNNHINKLKDETFLLVLTASNWDDYGFKTDFVAWMHNLKTGIKHGLGTLKVGYRNQIEGSWTIDKIKDNLIQKLDDEFFSMFNSEDSYEAIFNCFEIAYDELLQIDAIKNNENKADFIKRNVYSLLGGLNDIIYTKTIKYDETISNESVFKSSFLRSTSIDTILYSYDDIVHQRSGITNFEIRVENLTFRSSKLSKPSSNIHAIIGSNGCGKSHILDLIVENYINKIDRRIKKLMIISFSPFDKLTSYKKYLLIDSNVKINYIGIKDFYIHVNNVERKVFEKLKSKDEIQKDFIDGFYLAIKKDLDLVRYVFEILKENHPNSQLENSKLDEFLNLNTDENSESESLDLEKNLSDNELKQKNISKFDELSSGYQMIIYTVFSLIAHMERGTVVLYDEPEVYLHPPLMLTYIKILREIFIRKNGMGIFATHSPIILQEIPKSCVNIIKKIKDDGSISYSPLKPESYASSITSINNEVFKLETIKTGFYKDIYKECEMIDASEESKELSNEDKITKVLDGFQNQVGDEGLAIIYDFFYKDEQ